MASSAKLDLSIRCTNDNAVYDAFLRERGVDRSKKIGQGLYGFVCRAGEGGVCKVQSPRKREGLQQAFFNAACSEAHFLELLTRRDVKVIPPVDFILVGNLRLAIGMRDAGANLYAKYIHRQELPDLGNIQGMMSHFLNGLSEIHDQGIIHGDIKPENMTDRYLLDMGISMYEKAARPGKLICSRFYRPPEIIFGEMFTSKVDVFSLGALFFELYTGLPLFPIGDEYERGIDDVRHMHSMQNVMGQALPEKFLSKSKAAFYDEGRRRSALIPLHPDHKLGRYLTFDAAINAKRDKTEGNPRQVELFKDLLRGLVAFDPEKRLSAKEALQHPFFSRKEGAGLDEEGKENEAPEEDCKVQASPVALEGQSSVQKKPAKKPDDWELGNQFAALVDLD